MKKYTVAEFARMTGKSTTAIYKGLKQGLKRFETVENGVKYLCFPDDADPLSAAGFQPKFETRFEPSLKPSSTDQEAQGEPFQGSPSIEALTKERDGLAAILGAREAHIQALTQELDRLRADLEAERAAHREDRAKDRETLDRAMDRQHELSVLLLQEQNRHKPLRLLLAEKAGSIFHRKEKNENDT